MPANKDLPRRLKTASLTFAYTNDGAKHQSGVLATAAPSPRDRAAEHFFANRERTQCVSVDELPRASDAEMPGVLMSLTAAADRLGVSRRMLIASIQQRQAIGWINDSTAYRVPAAQFDASHRVLNGIPQLLEQLASPARAWWWLNSPDRTLDGETPLALLERGAVHRVLAAASDCAAGIFV